MCLVDHWAPVRRLRDAQAQAVAKTVHVDLINLAYVWITDPGFRLRSEVMTQCGDK